MFIVCIDDMDEVFGLEMGVDDYVCKLVCLCVLLVCICVLLWCSEVLEVGVLVVDSKCLVFGCLVIDNVMCEVWLDGIIIELISVEFDLFWLLVVNVGCIFFCEEIFNVLCGIEYDG